MKSGSFGVPRRQRAPRQKLVMPARMLNDNVWFDIVVRNVSPEGAMAEAAVPPPSGSYVEIRRGRFSIVARVVWRTGSRFGLHCARRLDVDALLAEPGYDHDMTCPVRRGLSDRVGRVVAHLLRRRRLGAMQLGLWAGLCVAVGIAALADMRLPAAQQAQSAYPAP